MIAITKDEFLKKYNIDEKYFLSADISWDDLCEIYDDFSANKYSKYDDIREDFLNKYLKDMNKGKSDDEKIRVHSYLSRVKDPEHLIAKIIRKRYENRTKYKKIDKNNYEKFITDLIGIRCLILFKDDWESFHNYILSQFDNDATYYIKDSISDFDDDESHSYIAEDPKAHIRNGDARDLYDKLLSPDAVYDGKIYRSVHYIIKYRGVYLEIQVRTLFEEGWGEIDHAIVYPYSQNNETFEKYTELLNRLTGLADEMGSFFCHLKEKIIENPKNVSLEGKKVNDNEINSDELNPTVQNSSMPLSNHEKETPHDCLKSVLAE